MTPPDSTQAGGAPDALKPRSYFNNWITAVGAVLAIGALFSFALLVAIDFSESNKNPYLGILTYLVAPIFLIAGIAATWIELVTPIFDSLKLPANIEFIDMPDALRGKYQYHTCANTRRLLDSGWSGSSHPLAGAVRDYVTNYLLPDRRLGDVPEP